MNRFPTHCLTALVLTLLFAAFSEGTKAADSESILDAFVQDFASDPFARPMTFGFKIDDKTWHMVVSADERDAYRAELRSGLPTTPALYWELSSATLARLYAGMNGETATSRARADDPVLLRTRAMPGFPRYTVNDSLNQFLEELRLHFWTRGTPEVIELSREHAVVSHGGNVVGLVYRPGMRTVWYEFEPGAHVNADPEDQVNDFDSLMIATKGAAQARIGEKTLLIEAGKAYLIPAGVAHEFWNEEESPLEVILVMYGEGA